jgi:hypothetical protein
MFLGHYALALAAKRAAPRLSLGALFLSAQFADILWPFLLAAGLEEVRIDQWNTAFTPLDFVSYPYSHSLALLVVWGGLAGWLFAHLRRGPGGPARRETIAIVAALVISHWVLDVVTHRPDMPLYPGGPKFGLDLWSSIAGTVAIELMMYLAGMVLYLRTTRARDDIGRWGFMLLASTLLLIYVGDALNSQPPPSVDAFIGVAMAGGVLITAWSWWVDRHRMPVEER